MSSEIKNQTTAIIPATPGFYALFLSPRDLPIPRQFSRHAIVAWQVKMTEHNGTDYSCVVPICTGDNGNAYDFILQPDGSLVHITGFTCNASEVALSYSLDQETMGAKSFDFDANVYAAKQ
jgi:hypothetical protein